MKKKFNEHNNCFIVEFSLPIEATLGATSVVVLGDFNDWQPLKLKKKKDKSFAIEIEIPAGADYHFRYLLDEYDWVNDWFADYYHPSPIYPHIENSVISLHFEKKQKPDDLKKIEGIGPKIAKLLNDKGIFTFGELAIYNQENLKGILQEAGPTFTVHDPTTWPKQAELAKNGEWDVLKTWQEKLKGGK